MLEICSPRRFVGGEEMTAVCCSTGRFGVNEADQQWQRAGDEAGQYTTTPVARPPILRRGENAHVHCFPWDCLASILPLSRAYVVITRQIVFPSATPSETCRKPDGEISTKESLNAVTFPLTFSCHELTRIFPSHLAVPRSSQPSLFAQVRYW